MGSSRAWISGVGEVGGGEGWVWTSPACSGKPPAAREMHAAGMASGGALLIHGGRGGDAIFDDLHLLDVRSYTWSGPLPSAVPRVGHAAAWVGVSVWTAHSCVLVLARVPHSSHSSSSR